MFGKFRARIEIECEDFPDDGALMVRPQGQRLIEQFDRLFGFSLMRHALRENGQRFDRPRVIADGPAAIVQCLRQPAENDKQPGLSEQCRFQFRGDDARLLEIPERELKITDFHERAAAIGQRLRKVGLEPQRMIETGQRLLETFQLEIGQAHAVVGQGIERLRTNDPLETLQGILDNDAKTSTHWRGCRPHRYSPA